VRINPIEIADLNFKLSVEYIFRCNLFVLKCTIAQTSTYILMRSISILIENKTFFFFIIIIIKKMYKR